MTEPKVDAGNPTFPHKSTVKEAIDDIFLPLKKYMIGILNRFDELIVPSKKYLYGVPPKKTIVDSAISLLNKESEIHGLSDFFRDAEMGEAFKYLYCRHRRIRSIKKGKIPSEGDDFQRRVETLHDARNKADHTPEGQECIDIEPHEFQYYGSILLLLSMEMGDPKVGIPFSEKYSDKFGINTNVRKLKVIIEKYEVENRRLLEENYILRKENDRLWEQQSKFLDVLSKTGNNADIDEDKKKQLLESSQEGDLESQYELSCYYLDHETDNDGRKAVFWLDIASKNGSDKAQWLLGMLYHNGVFVDQSDTKAFNLFKKSAEQGNPKGQLCLGYSYCYSIGVGGSYNDAFMWFLKAAEQGDAEAEYALGLAHYTGNGAEKSPIKAFNWFLKAAEQGYTNAQLMVGLAYYRAEGTVWSTEKAFNWFLKAAEQGNYIAQYWVGYCYHHEEGVKLSIDDALHYYSLAEEQCYAWASYEMGQIYRYRQDGNASVDEAKEHYLIAKKNADEDSYLWYQLGEVFDNKDGGLGLFDDAIECYNKVIDIDKYRVSDAHFRLGLLFEKGYGFPKPDYEEAEKHYLLSDNHESKYRLGLLYENVTDLGKSIDSVIECYEVAIDRGADGRYDDLIFSTYWYNYYPERHSKKPRVAENSDFDLDEIYYDIRSDEYEAAEHGDPLAQCNLGIRYLTGYLGHERSHERGFEWIKKSANQGHPWGKLCYGILLNEDKRYQDGFNLIKSSVIDGCDPGLYYLGKCYFEGKGVSVDKNKAAVCFRICYEKMSTFYDFNYSTLKANSGVNKKLFD